TLTLALDRYEAPAGGGTAVALAAVNRLNGFTGPIELSIVGDEEVGGKATVASGQTTAIVPLLISEDARPGAYRFRVRGKATVAANAAAGPAPLLLRATAKVGGKDYAVTPPPVVVEVIEAKKKNEPKKKEEPKKDKDKP